MIIDIADYIVESVRNENVCKYEKFKIFEAIKNGTPIPDNATNGDVIKAMFGKEFADKCIDYCNAHMVGGEWWNAPYQKGGK